MEGITIISLKDGSYFFNLDILANFSLLKEVRKAKKIESEKPAFEKWIWNKLKAVGEVICVTRDRGSTISWREQTTEVYFNTYILGFEVEHFWAKTSFFDLIKNLTEREWDLAAMDPEVVSNFKSQNVCIEIHLCSLFTPRDCASSVSCHAYNFSYSFQFVPDPFFKCRFF
jgi:hypothetical protein